MCTSMRTHAASSGDNRMRTTIAARTGARKGARLVAMSLALGLGPAGCSREAPVDFPIAGDPWPSPGAVPAAATRVSRRALVFLTSPPSSGTVVVEPGPFTDRVHLTGLVVEPGARPKLTGNLAVTTAVSELMALEVVADFYDRDGYLLGSAVQTVQGESVGGSVREDGHGHPSEAVEIGIAPEAPFQREAVAAVITVTHLVDG
jgi:hypothetical protein